MRPDEFSYKGIESSIYNLICTTTSRQLLPQMRMKTLEINDKHGIYDFGSSSYAPVTHAKHVVYVGDNIEDMRYKARQIAAWLRSSQFEPLIFGDEPDKYYLARIPSGINLESLIKIGEFDVVFECQPMANCLVDTGDNLDWETDLPWDSDITWNTNEDFTFDVSASPTEITFNNYGLIETGVQSQIDSKFNIEITGSFTTLSITMNDKTINYNESVSNGTVIIDNTNATIKTNGINKISVCSGDLIDFFEVIPGENIVTITGAGLNCSVLFNFRPQYL